MIGIIFIGNLKYCPYIDKYLKIAQQNNVKCDIIYWDRENLDEHKEGFTMYPFKYFSQLNKNTFFKLADFYNFGRFASKIINKNKYEKLILLSTLSGIVLTDILFKKYKYKYIFDIRDYSYENFLLFKILEEKIIKYSWKTVISSPGFKKFLPTHYEYMVVHNFNYADIIAAKVKNMKKNHKIKIGYIGSIRHLKHDMEFIKKFINNNQFELIYHGDGPSLEILKKNTAGIDNIKFTGGFNSKDKPFLMEDIDFLNNHYPVNKTVINAISNKYYDSIIYKIPQIVNKQTITEELVEENRIGLSLSIDDKFFTEKIIDFYYQINKNQFNNNCTNALNLILEEDLNYINLITDFYIGKSNESVASE